MYIEIYRYRYIDIYLENEKDGNENLTVMICCGLNCCMIRTSRFPHEMHVHSTTLRSRRQL